MSEFDWRNIPGQIRDEAESYLLLQSIDADEVLSVANDHKTSHPAEIVAAAKVWELADLILRSAESGQASFDHERMYLLGRSETVMNLYRKCTGFPGEYMSGPKSISEEDYLLFGELTDEHLTGQFAVPYEASWKGKMGAEKTAETKRGKRSEDLDNLADALTELSKKKGSVTRRDLEKKTGIPLSRIKNLSMSAIRKHASRK